MLFLSLLTRSIALLFTQIADKMLFGLISAFAGLALVAIYMHSRRTRIAGTWTESRSSARGPNSNISLASVFPPSRRFILQGPLNTPDANEKCSDWSQYTPTGFATADIKKLGRFPDYAALSGVPLPRSYLEFDINKALPRPYRPFRWTYHQTMCISLITKPILE